ncbi:hypothetical protein DFS34DRAFT_576741 [Phlyctochytrium arcticum]|nr:hypothetical protein DFS34DRAFT_576741 [Phlyctochytrium arcticum]
MERTAVPQPINEHYRPDAKAWKCTCPSFAINRFLICKHLVQLVHPVPVTFFWEVSRRRTAPYWQHPTLRVIHDEDDDDSDNEGGSGETEEAAEVGGCVPDEENHTEDAEEDEDSDSEVENEGDVSDGDDRRQTLEEEMGEIRDEIADFLRGLEFQTQFCDHRFLQALKNEGASFLKLVRGALQKEKRLQGTRGQNATTWNPSSTNRIMFYRPQTDQDT